MAGETRKIFIRFADGELETYPEYNHTVETDGNFVKIFASGGGGLVKNIVAIYSAMAVRKVTFGTVE